MKTFIANVLSTCKCDTKKNAVKTKKTINSLLFLIERLLVNAEDLNTPENDFLNKLAFDLMILICELEGEKCLETSGNYL